MLVSFSLFSYHSISTGLVLETLQLKIQSNQGPIIKDDKYLQFEGNTSSDYLEIFFC